MVLKSISLSEKKDREMQVNYCSKLTSDTKELCSLLAENECFAIGTDQKNGSNDYSWRLNRAVSSLLVAVRDSEDEVSVDATQSSVLKRQEEFLVSAQDLVTCLQNIKRLCYMQGGYEVTTIHLTLLGAQRRREILNSVQTAPRRFLRSRIL